MVTLFSGYDSQALALDRLKQTFPKFDYELVAWCEIDKAACIAHNALYPCYADRNIGDITKADPAAIPDCDLMTWSFPCTDISVAGKGMGLSEGSGTRSSLAWDAINIFRVKKPKYLLMENVAALLSKKFIKDYHKILHALEEMGYECFTQILDASKYGVPQHRERVFMISILREKGEPSPRFYFPKPFPLERRLKDVLEEHVDEKYYLSDKMLEYFNRVNEDKTHNHKFSPADMGGAARTVKAKDIDADSNFVQVEGYCSNSQDGVVCNKEGISPCHTAGHGNQPKIIE